MPNTAFVLLFWLVPNFSDLGGILRRRKRENSRDRNFFVSKSREFSRFCEDFLCLAVLTLLIFRESEDLLVFRRLNIGPRFLLNKRTQGFWFSIWDNWGFIGHRVTEWQTPKVTQNTGGWVFFVPDFNKLPYLLRSQAEIVETTFIFPTLHHVILKCQIVLGYYPNKSEMNSK